MRPTIGARDRGLGTRDSGTVNLVVDSRPLMVPAGTTVAAALLDAGVVGFRRSVSGEPRAPLCGIGICYECRLTIDGIAHRRACLVPVAEGMRVHMLGGEDA